MRTAKLAGAMALVAVSSPALACDLDGMGEHRFFAFANMARHGAAADPNDRLADAAPKPKIEQSTDDGRPGDSQAEADQSSDGVEPSDGQSAAPSDGPSDGATFR